MKPVFISATILHAALIGFFANNLVSPRLQEVKNDKKQLKSEMTASFNKNAYKLESAEESGMFSSPVTGTYVVSRNDSLFQVKAEYAQIGESKLKQAKITENKFVGMKFK